jgi:hypothetical protein
MRSYLCISGDLLGVFFLGCSVGCDVDNEENANVLVDGGKLAHVVFSNVVANMRGRVTQAPTRDYFKEPNSAPEVTFTLTPHHAALTLPPREQSEGR